MTATRRRPASDSAVDRPAIPDPTTRTSRSNPGPFISLTSTGRTNGDHSLHGLPGTIGDVWLDVYLVDAIPQTIEQTLGSGHFHKAAFSPGRDGFESCFRVGISQLMEDPRFRGHQSMPVAQSLRRFYHARSRKHVRAFLGEVTGLGQPQRARRAAAFRVDKQL